MRVNAARLGAIIVAALAVMAVSLTPVVSAAATAPTVAPATSWLCSQSATNLPWLRSTSSNPAAAKVVQARLNALGYDSGPVDGVYGSVTQAAVRRYQADRDLFVDGKVGPQTWRALQADSCSSAVNGATTTITLDVRGCDGCTLLPKAVLQTSSGRPAYVDWTGPRLTVSGGRASFRIPTRYTRGMSLEIRAPWEKGNVGAVLLVALSAGRPSSTGGSYIEDQHCWAGTSAKSRTLSIKVVRQTGEGLDGRAVYPNAYLTSLPMPDQPPGHQDLPYCTVPR